MQYPWRYSNEALANYQFFARLHTNLFPYIYTYAKEASTDGLPILRPLVLMEPDDTNTFSISHTYHFGNELLVGPVITPNAVNRQVYLPAGNWFDFWTNERHTGKQSINWTDNNQSHLPLFVREGAIVPMLLTPADTLCDANYVNNAAIKTPDNGLLFLIYPGGSSRFTVFDGTDVQCVVTAGQTSITIASKARPLLLQIHTSEPAALTHNGAPLAKSANPDAFDAAADAWRFDAASKMVLVKLNHAGGTATLGF
jgi:alpha-glucosidase (family GH31 glycosyl hydrolase)